MVQGGLPAAGGLLCDWRGESAVLMHVGLPLSGGGFGEEDPGGGCLEEVAVAVRPEPPVLTPPGGPNSRARCGRGTYLPSLENQMEEKEAVRRRPGLPDSEGSPTPTCRWARWTQGCSCPPCLGPQSCICPPRSGPRRSPEKPAGGTAGCSRSRRLSEPLAPLAGGRPPGPPSPKACWESTHTTGYQGTGFGEESFGPGTDSRVRGQAGVVRGLHAVRLLVESEHLVSVPPVRLKTQIKVGIID